MFALIMAGGVGTRFWPRSRLKKPKQVLNILGPDTMVRATVARVVGLVPEDRIFVVSVREQRELLQSHLPQLKPEQIIAEPRGKNTAPCIGLSALYMRRIDPEAVMIVLPADQTIARERTFRKVLKAGEIIARKNDCLVTIGIKPTYPATGYGYIQHNGSELERLVGVPSYEVKTFAEKPTFDSAERFLESGDFLWNSGIFIWKVDRILREIEDKMPELYDCLCAIDKAIGKKSEQRTIEKVYKQIRSISIDYGVMEKAKKVVVLKGDFGWSDVGSWQEVYNLGEKDKNENVADGKFLSIDSKGCYVYAPKRLVAAIGVNDLVIVDTNDALLICKRDRSQDVKELVELLRRNKMEQYL